MTPLRRLPVYTLSRLRKSEIAIACGLMVLMIFGIDWASGNEISLSIFYLTPIAIVTWIFGRTQGLWVSTLCAILWLAGERLTGAIYSNNIIPIWNTAVRFGFFVIVTHILSTRRRIEQDLIEARVEAFEASRAKSEFVNRVTHELRTPLTAILGFADILTKHTSPYLTLDDQECLRRIRVNAESLLRMVDGVLEVGRVEAGKIPPKMEEVDIGAMLLSIAGDMRSRPRQDVVELIVEEPPQTAAIQTDPVLLRQILLNLVSNSIKFTEDGYIRLSVKTNGNADPISIVVEDTGIGIAAERLHAIFEPFEQADSSIHRRFGGAGLGLAITKELCEQLGYRLTVDTEPGKGSRFSVVLN
jgi:signal transduction histidine kinase